MHLFVSTKSLFNLTAFENRSINGQLRVNKKVKLHKKIHLIEPHTGGSAIGT